MKVLLIAIMTWMVNLCLAQQNQYNLEKKYFTDSVKSNIDDLIEELARKHPGFYRYRTKEQWRFKIDSTYGTITDSLIEFEIIKR